MEKLIKLEIDNYLEFDSDGIFLLKPNIIRIFGGSIRDIIAKQPIHDIDILCGSKSVNYVESVLEENGYKFIESLNGKDLKEMYSEIHVINEPHTWMKGQKIIQLIRPAIGSKLDSLDYKLRYEDLIANVDISCCGVSWDGQTLFEDYPNSIVHCQNRVFSVNSHAKMYSPKRINHRREKLISRGWVEIQPGKDINRDLKLNILDIP